MNAKQAKKLRQLVNHLQAKAAEEDGKERPWSAHGNETNDFGKRRTVLDYSCGKAVYKSMKKRANTLGTK